MLYELERPGQKDTIETQNSGENAFFECVTSIADKVAI